MKYPIKISYQIAFMKEVILRLEKQNAEIHDALYSAYGRLMAQPNQEQFFYKHYITANSNKPITLKESASLISEGTTGLRTWQVKYDTFKTCILNVIVSRWLSRKWRQTFYNLLL